MTRTTQTHAEALAVPVDVALADLLKFEFHFRTTGNPIVAKRIRDIHATLARSAGVGTEFDPMLIARMLRRYATALENDGGVRIGKYKPAAVREQADLIEASIGQAVTAPASAAKGVANP